MRRNIYALLGLCLILPLLMGAGCTGDEGPKGDKGDQGPTGPQGGTGPEGPSGIADCVDCHNDNTTMLAMIVQWRHSLHSSPDLLWEINRSPCNVCHTSEGYVSNLAGAAEIAENPTMVGCRTCHSPHTNENFALRTVEPVTLMNGVTFDKGKGNLCASCHHARPDVRTVIAEPTTITNTRFGPHESPQAEGYWGTGGYEYGEQLGQSSHKNIADACVTCHMADPIGAQVGGHTFNVAAIAEGEELKNLAICSGSGCHAEPEESFNEILSMHDYDGDGTNEGIQDEFDGLSAQLFDALFARGLVNENGLSTAGTRTAAEAGAIYNFRLAMNDSSRGIHNPPYIMGLMQLALDNLPALPKTSS